VVVLRRTLGRKFRTVRFGLWGWTVPSLVALGIAV